MKEKCFDNGKGELIDQATFVRENVLDTDGFLHKTKCPNCGKQASERDFDECLGGTINRVYSIDCKHCGFHECDKEFCYTCEAKMEESILARKTELENDMDDGNSLTLRAEFAIQEVANKGLVSGVELTTMKLILIKNPRACAFFDLPNESLIKCTKEAVGLLKKHLLNANFNRNLEMKISQALEEMA
ncbi:hypothetical protein FG064_16535 [Vibrio cholerae]|uniref:hypothetical protein n=1 Tax=Vibrio cholerae TaxID=666 RepID=UPI0011DC634A|nr:hypothetical protein [Vibrio cholerae]EGR0468605.1 hypothetical protein [Vibrio cholerae]TXY52016.1 hypothetical protein FXE74_18665 [Vibrio cholerae]GIB34695.1 hypothetical protein VCSRO91_3577 [Vibrio cholerae]